MGSLRVSFWGTRGSIAKPGPSTLRYGGNTSCVEVRAPDGTLIIFDCGTGAHGLGQALLASATGPLRGHILISHTHWDHIQGIPFFAPLFLPGNEWHIYAPRGLGRHLKETLAGQMQYAYFPVSLEQLGANIHYHELVEGRFTIGEFRIATGYLNHPALALGYRLEIDGVTLVYATDHEPHSRAVVNRGRPNAAGDVSAHPGDRRHGEFLAGADLLIHDAQYTAAEYPAKLGWGHSPVEYVVDTALAARVQRLALFHHDPFRNDDAVDRLVEAGRRQIAATGAAMDLFAAAEGQVVELEIVGGMRPEPVAPDALQVFDAHGSVKEKAILLAVADAETAALLTESIRPEGLQALTAADGDAALTLTRAASPDLVILDQQLPVRDGISVCRALRAQRDPTRRDVPVVLVAPNDEDAEVAIGTAAGVTDWLIKPFSSEYVRTKVCAWLLRTQARWTKAPLPRNEARRIEALRRLEILDTAAEERFDRLTRLATRLFDVPIALVSLVDSDRQWFKSCQGLSARQTSREVAFCAHAILGADAMVIPDALQDERFADNPLVTGDPHVRFYAGQPLCAPDGSAVGTLCIIDHRPRQLNESDLQALQDLGVLVEQEFKAGRPALSV